MNKTVSLYGYNSREGEGYGDGEDEEWGSEDGFIDDRSEDDPDSVQVNCDGCDEAKEALNEYIKSKKIDWEEKGSDSELGVTRNMLADFGTDPELRMRAVCALYRQQMEDEKASNDTIYRNGRGFCQFDAFRAGKLAEFLTDRVPGGDLNRTVEELIQYDPKGIEQCWEHAMNYSKQLFEIYENKEDPYQRPE